MKKWKPKYIPHYQTQTNIGKLFGLSAVEVGKKFAEAGLKYPKQYLPTTKAWNERFAIQMKMEDGTPFYIWETNRAKNIILSTM